MDIVCDQTNDYELAALIDTNNANRLINLAIQNKRGLRIGSVHNTKIINQLPGSNIYTVTINGVDATLRSAKKHSTGDNVTVQVTCLEQSHDNKPVQVTDHIIEYTQPVTAIALLGADKSLTVHDDTDSFDFFDLWPQIEGLQKHDVSLDGANLIIEATTALTTIDINITEKSDQTLNMVTEEIMRHIKLLNIGGQILLDYPHLNEEQRDRVETIIEKQSKIDRLQLNCYGFTEMGLFELSRQRHGIPIKDVQI